MAVSRKEPVPHTCPAINDIQDSVNDVLNNAQKEIAKIMNTDMERLREANEALRTWGKELLSELESVEDELKEVTSERDNLQREVEDLRSQLKELEVQHD